MSIRFIQSNYTKLDIDNIIKFILDLAVVQLEDVKPYEEGVIYVKGNFIYLKEKGLHKIYRCKVDTSSETFVTDEWENIMDTYDSEIKNVPNLNIREEIVIINKDNVNNIIIPGYKPGSSSVVIYKDKDIYLPGEDFNIDENGKITFKPTVNIGDGDRLIIEIKETVGLPDRLIILSDNGNNYEVGVVSDDLYIIQTDLKYSKPEVFIKDSVTEENYRIFMIDDELYFELTEIYTIQTEIKVLDDEDNEYKLEMVNGELMFSVKE